MNNKILGVCIRFRRRFIMSTEIFIRIVIVIEQHDGMFHQKRNAIGQLGASAIQKCVMAMHMEFRVSMQMNTRAKKSMQMNMPTLKKILSSSV